MRSQTNNPLLSQNNWKLVKPWCQSCAFPHRNLKKAKGCQGADPMRPVSELDLPICHGYHGSMCSKQKKTPPVPVDGLYPIDIPLTMDNPPAFHPRHRNSEAKSMAIHMPWTPHWHKAEPSVACCCHCWRKERIPEERKFHGIPQKLLTKGVPHQQRLVQFMRLCRHNPHRTYRTIWSHRIIELQFPYILLMIMVYYGILWCTVPWGCLFSQIYLIHVQHDTARTCFLVPIHSKSAPHHSWLTWPKVTDWWLAKNVPAQRWRNWKSASQKNVRHHNYHHYLIGSIDWSSLSWLVDQPWWLMGSEKSSTNHDAIIIGHKTDQWSSNSSPILGEWVHHGPNDACRNQSSNGWKMLNKPSGKHTKNYGKSPCLIGKSTVDVPFSIAMLNWQRVTPGHLVLNKSNIQTS